VYALLKDGFTGGNIYLLIINPSVRYFSRFMQVQQAAFVKCEFLTVSWSQLPFENRTFFALTFYL
jgi:predicted membrane-bound mannosyltransferase